MGDPEGIKVAMAAKVEKEVPAMGPQPSVALEAEKVLSMQWMGRPEKTVMLPRVLKSRLLQFQPMLRQTPSHDFGPHLMTAHLTIPTTGSLAGFRRQRCRSTSAIDPSLG